MSSKTVAKALDIMEIFTKDKPRWKLRELAREVDMNHTVVYRILATLKERGYIYQDLETQQYELGLKVLELSSVVEDYLLFTDVLEPIMRSLATETGESIVFTVVDNQEGVYVKIVESNRKVRFAESVGRRIPLYIGATHKIILAFFPEEIQKELAAKKHKNELSRLNFLEGLIDMKQKGWAYSAGETFDDVAAIAVPLFDYQNKILGSLSIASPRYRFSFEEAQEKLSSLLSHQEETQQFLSRISLPIRRSWVEIIK